jgi:serine/threonine-protein kinase
LAKDPKQRYQHAEEISVDLRNIDSTSARISTVSQPPTKHRRFPNKWSSLFIIVGMFAAMVIGVLLGEWLRSFHEENPAVFRFTVPLNISDDQILGYPGGIVSISPDGKKLVYPGTVEEGFQLFQHELHSLEATLIPGTEGSGGSGPVFSWDGKWLAFTQAGRIMRIPIDGGLPVTICEWSSVNLGLSWSSNDHILYSEIKAGTSMSSGLLSVSAFGGTPVIMTQPEELESSQHRHRFPSFLPGGDAALCTIWTGRVSEARVGVASLKTGNTKALFKGLNPRYTPTGHLLYVQDNGYLMAVPFDAAKLEVKGTPEAVLNDVTVQMSGGAKYAFSNNGTLVYLPTGYQKRAPVQVDLHGSIQYLTDDRHDFSDPRLSPDGKHIAVSYEAGGGLEIWNYDIQTGSKIRIAGARSISPIWSHDGQNIAYASNKYGTYGIFMKNADGTGEAKELLVTEDHQIPCSWSTDGDFLIFKEKGDLYTLSLNQGYERRALIKTPFNEFMAAPSPDGRWLAYTSDQSGQVEVYVTEFPSPQKRYLISVDGGNEPVWSKNSKELFYRTAEHLIAVTFETEPAFRTNKRTTVLEMTGFEPVSLRVNSVPNYDVFQDGERFLMIKKPETPPHVVVVVNWFEELKHRVPTED